jgi:N utilization substance protein A
LGGERIDVIKWDGEPANFVSNALSPAQVLEVETFPDEYRASVVVPDRMVSLAIGKDGQNARLAAKLTGWRIDIRSQAAADMVAQGVTEGAEASTFEPFAPGEEPDLDLVASVETPPVVEVPATPVAATAAPAPAQEVEEPTGEEDVSFAAGLQAVPIPDREEREAEDYGEEEDDDEEEYEVPDLAAPEERPTMIRFAEDVLPTAAQDDEAKKAAAAKKTRRPTRYVESDDEDDEYEYSGRIR